MQLCDDLRIYQLWRENVDIVIVTSIYSLLIKLNFLLFIIHYIKFIYYTL
jgi:hypothetical protein